MVRDVRASGWLLGLLLFAGLCFVVVRLTEVERWVALARDARPGWLFVALVMQAATYLCVAVVWRATLVATRTAVPMRTLIGLSIAKLYADQVLPSGGVSGGAFVVSALRALGVDRSIALTVLLVMTLGYYAAYLAATVACLLLLWLYHRLEVWMLLVASVFSVVAVVIPAALLWARGRARSERLQRVLPKRFAALLTGFAEVSIGVVEQPRLLLLSTALQASIFALDAGTLWAALHAVGVDGSFWVALPSLVLASIVTTIGPVPLGLGTFEATAVGTLVALGTPLQAALAATLLLRGFTVWLPMLPGLYLARRGLRPIAGAA